MVSLLQSAEHVQGTLKQAELMLTAEIMMPIPLAHVLNLQLIEAWRHMRQRIVQAQANHERRLLSGRYRLTNVGTRCLYTLHDQRRRVIQGAIPIKHDQVKLAGAKISHVRSTQANALIKA
jgi:hypothetical protein